MEYLVEVASKNNTEKCRGASTFICLKNNCKIKNKYLTVFTVKFKCLIKQVLILIGPIWNNVNDSK